jgi:hypothetical protein
MLGRGVLEAVLLLEGSLDVEAARLRLGRLLRLMVADSDVDAEEDGPLLLDAAGVCVTAALDDGSRETEGTLLWEAALDEEALGVLDGEGVSEAAVLDDGSLLELTAGLVEDEYEGE